MLYNTYKTTLEVTSPPAYIIPQGYTDVVERLQANGVKIQTLTADTIMQVEHYYIEDYTSTPRPYEGHFLHKEVTVKKVEKSIMYYAGDHYVPTDQDAKRYIVQTLEPQAVDSYFAWNFFDGILMQKEYFSSYVFEDLATELLSKDANLKKEFLEKKKSDESFAKNSKEQLDYIYKRSPHYEPTHLRYPVSRAVL